MSRHARLIVAAVALLALVLVAGCAREEPAKLDPKVAPPAIAAPGVLTVGVDLENPPLAGSEGGEVAGLDVDVAAALAERLGLTVEYVDVKPSDAATALAQGSVDIVMSVPSNDASLSAMALAGYYVTNGPALFVKTEGTASVEPSLTIESDLAFPIAAQRGSESYWIIESEFGEDAVAPFDSLREALEALAAGEVSLTAGDLLVGSYIARDIPSVRVAGQCAPATPLAVAVRLDNGELEEAVRAALDELAVGGVFDTLRAKWVGDVPELAGPGSGEETVTP